MLIAVIIDQFISNVKNRLDIAYYCVNETAICKERDEVQA